MDPNGIIPTIAGDGFVNGIGFGRLAGDEGPATQASLNFPNGMSLDGVGNLYFADSNNNRIRKIDLMGIITTVAGSGPIDARSGNGGFSGDGGQATQAGLFYPLGTVIDGEGNLYIADAFNNRIRKVIGIAEPPPTPIIVLSTTLVDFDDVLVGHTSEQSFQVSNAGTAALVITAMTDDSDQFDVSPTAPPDISIAPDQNQSVAVTFAPTSPGIKEATLTLAHQAGVMVKPIELPPTSQVSLRGRGVARGDLTRDLQVNILDIIALVRLILGRDPLPPIESLGFALADVNGDGALNVLDIVSQVNLILGIPSKALAGPARPVTISLGEVQTLASGLLAVPVTLQADEALAGVQATVTFDAARLQIGPPQGVGRAAGMTFQSQVTEGTLRVVVYSATSQSLAAGSGTTLLVPVTVRGDQAVAPTLTVSQVILANRQAQAVPVILGTSTVKVSAKPTVFALHANRPNPFNPTTQIAYDVPQPAHVRLTLYNVLGQEVIRLVDAVQSPGRYVVTWDGRNGHGQPVASGAYLYRLTTSTGVVQTRRMSLVR